MGDRVKLGSYTKSDLIWLIRRMCMYQLSDRDLRRAVDVLRFEKERKCFNQADEALKRSIDARNRYAEILRPYDSMRLLDIPMEVLKRADAAAKEARAAEQKWRKLMKIGEEQHGAKGEGHRPL